MASTFFHNPFTVQPSGCQFSSLTYGTYVYFTSPNDTDFSFALYTGWKKYYPTALRAALVLADFKLADAPNKHEESSMCGWDILDTVTVKGWHRGDVTAKDLFLSPNISHVLSTHIIVPKPIGPPSLITPPRQRFVREPPIPHRRPDAETITRAHNVLATNNPGADLAMFYLETVGIVLWAVAILLGLLYLSSYLGRWFMKRKLRRHAQQQQRQLYAEDTSEQESVELPNLQCIKSEAWFPGMRKLSLPRPCLGKRKWDRRSLRTDPAFSASMDGITLRGD